MLSDEEHLDELACLDVLDLTRRLGREPNVDTALHIMQWELGDLTKSWTYTKWHDDPDKHKAWIAEAKHALASLLFQCEVVALLLDTDTATLFDFGKDTVLDRIMDKEKKLGRFEHYVGDQKDE